MYVTADSVVEEEQEFLELWNTDRYWSVEELATITDLRMRLTESNTACSVMCSGPLESMPLQRKSWSLNICGVLFAVLWRRAGKIEHYGFFYGGPCIPTPSAYS